MIKLDTFFQKMPNTVEIKPFNNSSYVGFVVLWSEKGRGWGEYTFALDWGSRALQMDNEADRPETVKATMDRLVDDNPQSVKDFFHAMVDEGFKVQEDDK